MQARPEGRGSIMGITDLSTAIPGAEMTLMLHKGSGPEIEVSQLRPGEEDEWDQFVTSSPSASFSHLSGWATVVKRVLGHRSTLLVARCEGAITGVFPISLLRSSLFGDCLVSMPLAMY